jgi:hypothetical protein
VAMTTDVLDALKLAVSELDAEHMPQWVNKDAYGYTTEPRDDLDPVGCVMCYPQDGDWPCTSAQIANDLRIIVHEHGSQEERFAAGPGLPHPSDDIYRDVPR